MADPNFSALARGSVILRWSPSGELTRWVVVDPLRAIMFGNGSVCGVQTIALSDDNSILVGSEEAFFSDVRIEAEEGFGYSFTYLLGEVYPLPEAVTFGTRTK